MSRNQLQQRDMGCVVTCQGEIEAIKVKTLRISVGHKETQNKFWSR
jgi:hypothetical protein